MICLAGKAFGATFKIVRRFELVTVKEVMVTISYSQIMSASGGYPIYLHSTTYICSDPLHIKPNHHLVYSQHSPSLRGQVYVASWSVFNSRALLPGMDLFDSAIRLYYTSSLPNCDLGIASTWSRVLSFDCAFEMSFGACNEIVMRAGRGGFRYCFGWIGGEGIPCADSKKNHASSITRILI